VGCFKDTSTRALPTYGGVTNFADCANKAKAANAPYFGLQYAGSSGTAQCYYGGTNYNKYGTATSCKTKDSSGNILGASWSNAVYKQ